MKGYAVAWEKGRKHKILGDVAVFGTKAEADRFKAETHRINPQLKAEIRKMRMKLKVIRV